MRVEIYGIDNCKWCASARELLLKRSILFVYHDMSVYPALKDEFVRRTNNAKTVPQIFVGDTLVGGYKELAAAYLNGTLQQMIGGE